MILQYVYLILLFFSGNNCSGSRNLVENNGYKALLIVPKYITLYYIQIKTSLVLLNIFYIFSEIQYLQYNIIFIFIFNFINRNLYMIK